MTQHELDDIKLQFYAIMENYPKMYANFKMSPNLPSAREAHDKTDAAHVLCPALTHGQFDMSELHPGSCFDSPLMLMNGSITVTRVLDAAVNGIVAMV